MKRWYMYTEAAYASSARMIPEATDEAEAINAAVNVYEDMSPEDRQRVLSLTVGLAESKGESAEPEPESVIDVLSGIRADELGSLKIWHAIAYTEDAAGECRAHVYPLDAVDISEAVAAALRTWSLLPYDTKQMAYTYVIARLRRRDVKKITANGDYVPDTVEGYLNLFPTIGTVFGWC